LQGLPDLSGRAEAEF